MREIRVPKAAHPNSLHVQYTRTLISIPLPDGLPAEEEIYDEIEGYIDVLLGRSPSPLSSPYLALAEVAAGYYARALELDILIHKGEDTGAIHKGSQYYKIRTGVLRSFIELSKRLYDLGSRRLSQEDLLSRQRRDAGEGF